LNFSNRGNFTGRTASFVSPEEPIRAELFSVERLERTWYTGSAGWTYRAALERIKPALIPLADDGASHRVQAVLG
jgi:hypothetical protein